jgi:hypothetical protein
MTHSKDDGPSLIGRYRHGLRTSIRNNSAAFGYSIVATADFTVLEHSVSAPGLKEIYLFIAGAAGAFALLEAVATRFFTEQARGELLVVIAMIAILIADALGIEGDF